MINDYDVYRADEVAEILKLNKRAVYKLLRSEKLKGKKINNKLWRVLGKDLKKYLET